MKRFEVEDRCLYSDETGLTRLGPVLTLRHALARLATRGVKGFVFVATTGRSGSHSLEKIFGAVDGAVCFHEPYPRMYRNLDRDYDVRACLGRRFGVLKNLYVRQAARGHRWYVETNHQFIKNFAPEAIAEYGDRIRVLHLVRNPVSVARSFLRIGSVPGLTDLGRKWLLDPDAPDNLLPISDLLTDDPAFAAPLYRCLWYWYEVEARVEKLRADYPALGIPTVLTSDFNEFDRLRGLFDALGIPVNTDRLAGLVGTRTNTKDQDQHAGVAVAEAEEMNARLRTVLEARFGSVDGAGLRALAERGN